MSFLLGVRAGVAAPGGISRGGTPLGVDGNIVGFGVRGRKEMVVPALPPFVTQQSACELVVGSDVM